MYEDMLASKFLASPRVADFAESTADSTRGLRTFSTPVWYPLPSTQYLECVVLSH